MNASASLNRLFSKTALLAIATLACSSIADLKAIDNPDTTGWKDLFAADLADATNAEHWNWVNGELVAKDHETLWTKESYGDCIIDLEFKVAKESNSGVFLHSSDIKNVLGALEIQVHDSTDGSKYGMVIHADLNEWPEKGKNPDGTPNKFPKALKDFARKGPLGLQGLHGKAQAPVWYRNLKIKALE